MTKRALLPGEQEAWDRACAERRWVVRAGAFSPGAWFCADAQWMKDANKAAMMRRQSAENAAFSSDTIAYRARSVRADGSPVVP